MHKGFHKWRWRGLALWIVLMTAAIIYFGHENRRRTSEIQTSRIAIATAVCKDQNQRNDDTKAFIDRAVGKNVAKLHKAGASHADIVAAQAGGAVFKSLIDAMIPKRNCVKYVTKHYTLKGTF